MSLLGWEGFDHENLGNDLNGMPGWSGIGGTVQVLSSSLGGRMFNFVTAIPIFTPITGLSYTSLIGSGRLRINSTSTYRASFFSFHAASTASPFYLTSTMPQCGIGCQSSTNTVFMWQKSTANIIATGTTPLPANQQFLLETKVTIGSSTAGGYLEVHLNGAMEIPPTTTNTQGISSVSGVRSIMLSSVAGVGLYYDDFSLITVDATWPNDFIGEVHVDSLLPTGNSSVSWIPLLSSLGNFAMVDESQNDHDTTYNQSSAPTNRDLFTHSVINSTFGTPWDAMSIYGVGSIASMRKNDLTLVSAMTEFVSSGTYKTGASNDLLIGSSVVYDYVRDNYILDPTTSVQWNTAAVNASITGYQLST